MSEFIRLNITAEGQTEEFFVRNSIADHLGQFNISTDVRRVSTSKDKRKQYRGGIIKYSKLRDDIQTWQKEQNDKNVRFSTMNDLYRIPKDFPGFAEARKMSDPYKKVEFLESCFLMI